MANINVYERVTERIIEQLEQGIVPWQKPWVCKGKKVDAKSAKQVAFNRVTKRAYSMLNQMLLDKKGEWASFKQWHAVGGHIKAGEKGSMVVFWKWLEYDNKEGKTDEDGNIIKERIPFLRYDVVFHITQVDGVQPLTDKQLGEGEAKALGFIDSAEDLIQAYTERERISVGYGGDEAFYIPAWDSIQLPNKSAFKGLNEFYSTAFHEMTHSTGHKDRLDRKLEGKFGGKDYSKEELVAEIGAAALCNLLGIETNDTFKNSTAYIQSWLKALKNDPKMVVIASGQADKAVDYILDDSDEIED